MQGALDSIEEIDTDSKGRMLNFFRLVLTKIQEYGLFTKSEKCEFDRTSVEFLGYMISPTGITMDERKVMTITNWSLPT